MPKRPAPRPTPKPIVFKRCPACGGTGFNPNRSIPVICGLCKGRG